MRGSLVGPAAFLLLVAGCSTPAPLRAKASVRLTLPSGAVGEMSISPAPPPGELWNTVPLPADPALVADGEIVGTCRIFYARPRTLPAHIDVHLERRVAVGVDPCADSGGFTEFDIVTDFEFADPVRPRFVAHRCPSAMFSGPSVGSEDCVVASLGLILPEDPSGNDVSFAITGCRLDGAEGVATLDGIVTMGPCEVVE